MERVFANSLWPSSYALIIFSTSGFLTTSFEVKVLKANSLILYNIFLACTSPEVLFEGKSVCEGSPVIIHLNQTQTCKEHHHLLGCSVLSFIQYNKELFRVLPLIKASGATSMIFVSMSLFASSKSIISYKASYNGLRYG